MHADERVGEVAAGSGLRGRDSFRWCARVEVPSDELLDQRHAALFQCGVLQASQQMEFHRDAVLLEGRGGLEACLPREAVVRESVNQAVGRQLIGDFLFELGNL